MVELAYIPYRPHISRVNLCRDLTLVVDGLRLTYSWYALYVTIPLIDKKKNLQIETLEILNNWMTMLVILHTIIIDAASIFIV